MTKNTNFYPDTRSELDTVQLERSVLDYWDRENVFQKSLDGASDFVLYDGPPFANGLPHYGHLLTGYLKDLYARYKTMRGYKVERQFGWDCHGLPAEMQAEKELQISGKAQINEFGIDKFNNKCRDSVMKYSKDWRDYVKRQGRWVDFGNSEYKTMDVNFMESVIWAFKQLYEKGLIYEDAQVLPYSWKCETPVSNFETKLDNAYRQKASKTVIVAFTLKQVPDCLKSSETGEQIKQCKVLIWTTTPWTLPSNQALAIGKHVQYQSLIDGDTAIIASKEYMKRNYNEEQLKLCQPIRYLDLEGVNYQPPFSYFADTSGCFKIFVADFVTSNEGTGIVHIAPGFGEDDFQLCKKHGIKPVCPVDSAGRFTAEVSDFQGMNVLESNDEVIKALKASGCWVSTGQHIHNYPHCWRTDTPLIYKAVKSWYLDVAQIKDRMVELNKQVNWVPEHLKDGQFGKWLEGAKNWTISRNRFWGTPIPVWKSDNPDYPRIDVYGSVADLEEDFGIDITDLHRPFIDTLERINPDDPSGQSKMKRVEEVFDCWFESGSMPYGQFHYPFENKAWFENHFPADLIIEYISQTRGWFYTMFVLSTALFNRPPFKNCVCHGVVLDIKGQKLSKRLNNYQDPLLLMDTYGSDPLRFLMVSSPVCSGGSLLIDQDGNMIKDVIRLILKPLWNAFHFFCMYANVDGVRAIRVEMKKIHLNLDRYILSKRDELLLKIVDCMDSYNSVAACEMIVQFIDILNNWYIRRNRHRFWRSEQDIDKLNAYNTLYTVLSDLCVGLAPFLPMFTEHLWLGLGNEASVHLQTFPSVEDYNTEIVEQMDLVRMICGTGLSIRNRHNIRARQILPKITVYADRGILETLKGEYFALIQEEVNAKSLETKSEIFEIAELEIRPELSKIAERIPRQIPAIKKALANGDYRLLPSGSVVIEKIGVELNSDEYEKHFAIKDDQFAMQVANLNMIVSLDTQITTALELEGRMRDIIRFIQQARKDLGLDVTDRIHATVFTDDELDGGAIETFVGEIKKQTLSVTVAVKAGDKLQEAMFVFGKTGISVIRDEKSNKGQSNLKEVAR